MFTELALCSLLCIYLPIYNQSPQSIALANWQRATTADATATTEIVNKHDATRLEAAVQLCSLYWFSAAFFPTNVCGTHVLHLLCFIFVLANLPWAVHVPVCGVTFPSLLWLCAQWQNREAHSNLFLSESSFHNYRNKHCVWRV